MAWNYEMDRPIYGYRQSLSSTIKWLIVLNVLIFLMQLLVFGPRFEILFGLMPAMVIKKLMIWQLITYMFLHGGIFHITFNMLALWMFGSDVEYELGRKRFLFYYFFTGAGAGLCTLLLGYNDASVTIGASGAIFGILMAYGMMFPNRIILAFFIFPMRAKHFVILFGVIELMATISYTPDGVGHFAHLGGLLFGYIYLSQERRLLAALSEVQMRRREMWMRERIEQEIRMENFIKNEIDPILDKISKHGMESLTKRERKILENARDKMR